MRGILCVVVCLLALTPSAMAYTAAGDRQFPATIVLPQIAPTDEAYFTLGTQPFHSASVPGSTDQLTDLSATYNKTITERLSVGFSEGWNQFEPAGAGAAYGWQNLTTQVNYLAFLNPDHEFLMSVGAEREWGGTGATGVGSSGIGATTPSLFFGKGMGDAGIDYLKPLAITGQLGYSVGDTSTRPNLLVTGLVIEYSLPYLNAEVSALPLPDFVRDLTPMVEIQYTTPTGNPRGQNTVGTVAPGINYWHDGFELGLEALVPTTRAAGNGVGVIAQLHLSLDYLFPETIGRPLFSRH